MRRPVVSKAPGPPAARPTTRTHPGAHSGPERKNLRFLRTPHTTDVFGLSAPLPPSFPGTPSLPPTP